MKYIGNCKDWVQDAWIERILSTDGDISPIHQPQNQQGELPAQQELYKNFCNAGFDKRNFYTNMYTQDKTENILDLNVEPPEVIDMTGRVWRWWFIKILPGQLAHWHFDPHTVYCKNAERYWIAFQDYEPGHIFTWEGGNLLSNYVKGDVYKFDRATMMHGVANIGMTPKYSLQCTVHEPNEDAPYDKKYYSFD
jgi:hypothetical protein